MNIDERIARLEEKVKSLENDLIFVYDSLEKRIDDLRGERSDRFTLYGIAVAIFIGIIQITIALFKK